MVKLTWNQAQSILVFEGELSRYHFVTQEKLIMDALRNINVTDHDIHFDISKLKALDLSSAWQLKKIQFKLSEAHKSIQFIASDKQNILLNLIENPIQNISAAQEKNFLEKLQKDFIGSSQQLLAYIYFIGQMVILNGLILIKHARWRLTAFFDVVERAGWKTLPIIALLSFMIGVVITYQMGLQLRNYGANIFIVDFLGLAILREFGCLLTAIMVAGRTGSAFTAEIGMMKVNQEIDALKTMAVSPEEILLFPKIIGLICVLPLLTIWANVFGILGGMMMAKQMLGITTYDFLKRFAYAIPLRALLIGIGKAPVFGFLIGSIACLCGMQVKNNVDSVSRQTTQSVVLSIFFVIVFDALFSIGLSYFKL